MLGPLALGLWAVEFEKPIELDCESALWGDLQEAVTQVPKRGEERLVVADSKKVFQRSPLGWRRLEATALALGKPDHRNNSGQRKTPLRLVDLLPPGHPELEAPWYACLPAELPIACPATDLDDHRERLQRALHVRGARVCRAALRLLPARELNHSFARTQSKAATAWIEVVAFLADLMANFGQKGVYAVVDRQGGRKRYGDLLARDFPGCGVLAERESKERSDYWVYGPDGDLWISFRVGAEEQSLPTAAASCLAKYGREVSMRAFNDYFHGPLPDLAPTAGYVTDGRRWMLGAQEWLKSAPFSQSDLVRQR